MRYTQHPSNNRVLGAPPGWKQDGTPCGALPVTAIEEELRTRLVSYWRPSPQELQAIAAGALIELHVLNPSHPVVAIGVEGVRNTDSD